MAVPPGTGDRQHGAGFVCERSFPDAEEQRGVVEHATANAATATMDSWWVDAWASTANRRS